MNGKKSNKKSSLFSALFIEFEDLYLIQFNLACCLFKCCYRSRSSGTAEKGIVHTLTLFMFYVYLED